MFSCAKTRIIKRWISLSAIMIALTAGLAACGKGNSTASSILMGSTGVNLLNSVINPHPVTSSAQGSTPTGAPGYDPNTMDHTPGGMPIEIYQQQQEQQREQQQQVNEQNGQ
ncbi:hypothetical protein [Acidisoma cladoniae]|jgi:hypothetical protein|uniref:hypothetical protein n=1 Tax=Acidisoma cladoniae TaxID=3040935 RepID=UPI00254EB2A9|nr:hypothetical protein [Acidisoma sp. PAMC 29798]